MDYRAVHRRYRPRARAPHPQARTAEVRDL